MTAAEALRQTTARLAGAGVAQPGADARILMAFAMGIAGDRLTLHLGDTLSPEAERALEKAVTARLAHQPVSQIIGQRQFWGRMFRVTSDVLDPRPETETLVSAALEHDFHRVLDLGTGSGCILLSLLADRPLASGVGVDLSPAALTVAQGNAERLAVEKRATFTVSDWFSNVKGQFDLIVANPPYIAADEMGTLLPDVRDWEPHLALTPGGDGLAAYRVIARDAPAFLTPRGRLMVEIGPTQGPAVLSMFQAAGLEDARILHDMDGRDRVVVGLWQQPAIRA